MALRADPGRDPPALPCFLVAGLLAASFVSGCARLDLREETEFASIQLDARRVEVELAARKAARDLWLQLRQPPKKPVLMLVVFPEAARHALSSADLLFPADVASVTPDGTVVGIQRLVPGVASDAVSPTPTRLVLAAPAGTFDKLGVRPGASVLLSDRIDDLVTAAYKQDRHDAERERRDWGWPSPAQPAPLPPTLREDGYLME